MRKTAYQCAYCGLKTNRLTIDHIFPIVQGGTYDLRNLIAACKRCNNLKSNLSIEEFRTFLAEGTTFFCEDGAQKQICRPDKYGMNTQKLEKTLSLQEIEKDLIRKFGISTGKSSRTLDVLRRLKRGEERINLLEYRHAKNRYSKFRNDVSRLVVRRHKYLYLEGDIVIVKSPFSKGFQVI